MSKTFISTILLLLPLKIGLIIHSLISNFLRYVHPQFLLPQDQHKELGVSGGGAAQDQVDSTLRAVQPPRQDREERSRGLQGHSQLESVITLLPPLFRGGRGGPQDPRSPRLPKVHVFCQAAQCKSRGFLSGRAVYFYRFFVRQHSGKV